MEVGGQRHASAALYPREETRYPLYKRLGELQGWSKRVQKISLPLDYVNEKFQGHHRESNSRPSGLQRSASTNCATACIPKKWR